MSDSQFPPVIEPASAQLSPSEQDSQREAIANAAAEARRRAVEGYTTADFRTELKRSKRRRAWRRFGIVVVVIVALIAAAVAAVLLLFSVNQVSYSTMEPVLQDGQVVVSNKGGDVSNGDAVAYRDGATITFGRIVAEPGNWVNILDDGTLVISDEELDDAAASRYAGSGADVKVSRQIPSDSYFVLGDSENATISSIANGNNLVSADAIIGKSLYKVWPIANIGPVL